MFAEASRSTSVELRLVGILGLAAKGEADDSARDDVLWLQNFWSEVSYEYRELAASMLTKYWPNDKTLVKSALARIVERDFGSPWEIDTATDYLMASSADQSDVRAWILAELGSDYPFNVMYDRYVWKQVGRFAAVDAEIRVAANAYWCEPKNRLINMYKLPSYVAVIPDSSVGAALIEVLSDKTRGFAHHWALKGLLAGWGRDHPMVKPTIDALCQSTDEDIGSLVALLSEIMRDKATARERLIRISAREDVRRDLLGMGFEACGCDGSDNDAVAAMLAFPESLRGNFDASDVLFRAFGAHPDVRHLALRRVSDVDAPLAAIAASYKDDPDFARTLFDAAVPLPADLRAQVIEVATTGATGTSLEAVLSQAMRETDPELRARMVIAHHQGLAPQAREGALPVLLADVVAVGSEFDSVRAAALAGLVTIDQLETLATLEDRGKPVPLVTGRFSERITSVERLVCERFAEFQAVFGDSLRDRFESLGGSTLASILSVAPGASPAARVAFLALAEDSEMPLTSHALRALAAERPRSDLLLARCWDMLDSRNHDNYDAVNSGNVALILREHFPGNAGVRQRLVERFVKWRTTANAMPLAIFAPDAEELSLPFDLAALGRELADWTVAVHVAAFRADSTAFCDLLEAMVTRRRRTSFDAQQIANLAVEERLQRDPELEDLLTARIMVDVDPDISGSFARYLATAGKLGSQARGRVLDLLRALATSQRLPISGYDAIADQQRAVRATLLDAVSTGLELV